MATSRATESLADMPMVHDANPQSLNRYAYVLNSPLSLVDLLGLDCSGASTGTGQDVDPSLLNTGYTLTASSSATCPTGNFLANIAAGLFMGRAHIGQVLDGPTDMPAAISTGFHFTVGLRTRNQAYKQCIDQNSSLYSIAGITDLAIPNANGAISDSKVANLIAGNDLLSAYSFMSGALMHSILA